MGIAEATAEDIFEICGDPDNENKQHMAPEGKGKGAFSFSPLLLLTPGIIALFIAAPNYHKQAAEILIMVVSRLQRLWRHKMWI